MDDPTEILQRLHDSEINAQISWLFDAGFQWELVDNLKEGTTSGSARTARGAIYGLAEKAFAQFPRSVFAEWWKEARRAETR